MAVNERTSISKVLKFRIIFINFVTEILPHNAR